MTQRSGKGTIAVVTACMRADGLPDFAFTEVEVSSVEYADGVHYDRVEARLLAAGYEEPFVHFDELEAPDFLHAAIQDYVCAPDHAVLSSPATRHQEASWPVLSR